MRVPFIKTIIATALVIWGINQYDWRIEDGRLNAYEQTAGNIIAPVRVVKTVPLSELEKTAKVTAPQETETLSLTSQPIGHYEFCKRYLSECRPIRYVTPEKLTQAKMDELIYVNKEVNDQFEPKLDIDIFGKDEVWAYPIEMADCEDYALEKRRRFIKLGWPPSVLLITVVRQSDGKSGHAILTVRTPRFDLILDNLTDKILKPEETNYYYLKRQASNHAGQWVKLGNDPQGTAHVGG